MIDAVLSFHLNPQTCGVAKFNQQLAQRLGVSCWPLATPCEHPIISIKPQEMPKGLPFFCDAQMNEWHPRFELFLHGPSDAGYLKLAEHVYAGSAEIADAVRPHRPDVIEAFCPATVQGNPTRGAYRVLVFGMAHKLILPHFEQLKTRLDAAHPDYTIELSTAVHEGSPWDTALTESITAMRGIFGNKLRVLGYLGDDALAKELHDVDAVACYYVPALRANNTTAWAALEAGKTLYTNTDEYSPPLDAAAHSWDKLLELLRA